MPSVRTYDDGTDQGVRTPGAVQRGFKGGVHGLNFSGAEGVDRPGAHVVTAASGHTVRVSMRVCRSFPLEPPRLRGYTTVQCCGVCQRRRYSRTCFSHPDFNCRYRNFTGSTVCRVLLVEDTGSRVADCHRRFGLTPTPEHVLCVAILTQLGGCPGYSRYKPSCGRHGGRLRPP